MYVTASAMSDHTKLTLRLDAALIAAAKKFALEQDRSVSQLVADYFARLTNAESPGRTRARGIAARGVRSPDKVQPKTGPITASLRGVLKKDGSASAPLGRDDYRTYLERKYS